MSGIVIDRMTLPYNSGPYLTRQTVSLSDLTAVSTGHLRRASGHHAARRNPMASKPTCDAGCPVTLGRPPIRQHFAISRRQRVASTYQRTFNVILAVS